MRVVVAAFLTLVLAGPAVAQRRTSRVIPSLPPPRDPPPHFRIAPGGGALPTIGLPLPRIGLHPLPKAGGPRRHHFDGRFYSWPAMVFYVPQPVAVWAPVFEPPAEPVERAPAPGRLILDVLPRSAEVFADGYYVGVPEDFSALRGGGVLEPGLHRLDLSSPGYEPATVNLRVSPGQSVTYRTSLRRLPPPIAVPPTTFYLIPGCYLGNIPPKDARLPDTCDQSRAITWQP